MKLVTPNYSQRTPIVDDGGFTDAASSPQTGLNTNSTPKLGTPQTSYNPGQTSSPLPGGPPRFVSAPGRRPPVAQKAATNKRIGS